MIKNQIGLEAEYLLRKDGELVFPCDYGFDFDDFLILGEFRAKPGKTVAETIANFFLEYYTVLERAKEKGLTVDIKGWAEITPKFYSEILKKMGSKQINESQNIYGTDILECSDSLVEDGKIVKQYLSTGLHVHFSSGEKDTVKYTDGSSEYYYDPVTLPISIMNDQITTSLTLYKRQKNDASTKREITVYASRITKPVIKYFVEEMDILLSLYNLPVKLKYRNKGFYEIKPHGFEYRSFPFSTETLRDINLIVSKAFSLLESL
jgi:hypothetical protein